jgi:hypothetical protein
LAGIFSAINFIKAQDFVGFEGICYTKAFRYFGWIYISGRFVFLSFRNKKVSCLLIILLLKVKDA